MKRIETVFFESCDDREAVIHSYSPFLMVEHPDGSAHVAFVSGEMVHLEFWLDHGTAPWRSDAMEIASSLVHAVSGVTWNGHDGHTELLVPAWASWDAIEVLRATARKHRASLAEDCERFNMVSLVLAGRAVIGQPIPEHKFWGDLRFIRLEGYSSAPDEVPEPAVKGTGIVNEAGYMEIVLAAEGCRDCVISVPAQVYGFTSLTRREVSNDRLAHH